MDILSRACAANSPAAVAIPKKPMRILLALVLLQSLSSSAQQLANDQFNLAYSSTGLNSIKRVHDAYDTDYVAPGHTLGDVLIRYRPRGEAAWKEVQSGTASQPLGSVQGVSYAVGRLVPTIATSSHASS